MLAKLLLTLAVMFAAYSALRARRDTAREHPGERAQIPWHALRLGAYAVIALMLLVSGWSLVHQWQRGREVLEVQIVNPATGAVDHYQARRGDIEGRGFRTLDGQQVRIAEFERMILSELR